jgi:hypothetical protein
VQRVDAAGAVVADHVIFSVSWDITQRDRLHSHDHLHPQVAVYLQPGREFVNGDQRCDQASRTEDAETRMRLREGIVGWVRHDVEWEDSK